MDSNNPNHLLSIMVKIREDAAEENLNENFAWHNIFMFFSKNNISYDTPIDELHNTILHLAIDAGEFGAVKTILTKNPEIINHQNILGQTPLLFATKNNQTKIFEYLIKNGADKFIGDNDDVYPMHLAAYHCNSEMFFYFKKNSLTASKDVATLNCTLEKGPLYYLFAKNIEKYGDKNPIDSKKRIEEFNTILKDINPSKEEIVTQCNYNSDEDNYLDDITDLIRNLSQHYLFKSTSLTKDVDRINDNFSPPTPKPEEKYPITTTSPTSSIPIKSKTYNNLLGAI